TPRIGPCLTRVGHLRASFAPRGLCSTRRCCPHRPLFPNRPPSGCCRLAHDPRRRGDTREPALAGGHVPEECRPVRIAVVVAYFPSVSQTFVLNQITGLLDRGHEVDVYAVAP